MRAPGPISRRGWRRFLCDARGASAVEFALVAFPFLLLVFSALGFGQAIWIQNALQEGVSSAARCRSLYKTYSLSACSTDALTQANAVANTAGLLTTTSQFTVTYPTCGVQVSASYPFTVLGVMKTTFTMSAKACYPF